MRKGIATVIVVAILATGGWVLLRRSAPTATVKKGDVVEAVYGLGEVRSQKIYELKPGTTATIAKIYVKEGQTVKEGDPLLRFDERIVFRAPFAGTVTSLPYHEFENVFPQMSVLRLEDLKDLQIEVVLEQQGALRVRRGQTVSLSLESLRGVKVEGKVESIFSKDKQFVVKISSTALPPEILPNMNADVVINVGERKDVLLIPLSSIANGQIVRLNNGKRQKLDVKIGAIDGEWAEILEGEVKEGDEVLISRRN